MAFIQDALKVANIAALKALTSSTTPKRVDGAFYAVDDNGYGVPAWYLYSASATTSEDLPNIVLPTDTTGRFVQFGGSGGGSGGGVANIAALKALTSSTTPKRVDGAFYAVDNNGDGVPSWYLYSAASTATQNLPNIVLPTDTTGRFIQFGGSGGGSGGGSVILTVSNTSPIASPPSVTPITGGSVRKHLQITDDSYGTFTFTEWTGVDSTGVSGNNGWVYVNLT